MQDRILTLEQIAERTSRPLATHRYWRHLGVGPKTFRLGRRVVAFESDVEKWLREQADQLNGSAA
jgi:predicted DNA-binding transcriptional regulator AlpA